MQDNLYRPFGKGHISECFLLHTASKFIDNDLIFQAIYRKTEVCEPLAIFNIH